MCTWSTVTKMQQRKGATHAGVHEDGARDLWIHVQSQEVLVVPVVVTASKPAQLFRHVVQRERFAREAARCDQKIAVPHVVRSDVKIQTGNQPIVDAGGVTGVQP